MKKTAIIAYGNNSNKIMFWVLGRPCEIGKISIELGSETYEISILEIPHTKESKNKIKQRRIIEKFCGENNFQSIYYVDDNDDRLENIWSSVRLLCTLREISKISGENIFNKSFGIVTRSLNPVMLEAISEEASSIIILKTDLDQNTMGKLYKDIIMDKGLSIAFVDDVKFLMNQSKIILCENSALISPCLRMKNILVLSQKIENLQPDSIYMKYKVEIAKAIIKFLSNISIWEITPYFPFVYFLDEQGNYLEKEQIYTLLIRNNKALTIQKC